MTASEYVAAFASIILALAVTDLATSMHRLLRARKRVRWDWLPFAIALLILLGTVQFWWVFFDIWRSSSRLALGAFLPDFLTLLFNRLSDRAPLREPRRASPRWRRRTINEELESIRTITEHVARAIMWYRGSHYAAGARDSEPQRARPN